MLYRTILSASSRSASMRGQARITKKHSHVSALLVEFSEIEPISCREDGRWPGGPAAVWDMKN